MNWTEYRRLDNRIVSLRYLLLDYNDQCTGEICRLLGLYRVYLINIKVILECRADLNRSINCLEDK